MSQLASLISKFDSAATAAASSSSSCHYHNSQLVGKPNMMTMMTTTTYQLAAAELTTSGIHTNTTSSAISSSTTTPSHQASTGGVQFHLNHHHPVAVASSNNTSHLSMYTNPTTTTGLVADSSTLVPSCSNNLANSSASKLFNHTLTDSSTTGGTGTSTKSTNLFSLPVQSIMNGGGGSICGAQPVSVATTTFQITSTTDKESTLAGVNCDNFSDSLKLHLNTKTR